MNSPRTCFMYVMFLKGGVFLCFHGKTDRKANFRRFGDPNKYLFYATWFLYIGEGRNCKISNTFMNHYCPDIWVDWMHRWLRIFRVSQTNRACHKPPLCDKLDSKCHHPCERRQTFITKISRQYRFSGVYLVLGVFQERGFKETLAVAYLILQACISFLRRFRQEWRISVFVLLASSRCRCSCLLCRLLCLLPDLHQWMVIHAHGVVQTCLADRVAAMEGSAQHIIIVTPLVRKPWHRERKSSPKVFLIKVFWKPLRVIDIRAFGSWMSEPTCLFSRVFKYPDQSFDPGYPREWPPDVRGISVPRTYSLGWLSVFDDSLRWLSKKLSEMKCNPCKLWCAYKQTQVLAKNGK